MPFAALLFAVYIAGGFLAQTSSAGNHSNTVDNSGVSKRIEVYALSQNYWDTQYGDTISEIVVQLLPNNPSKHAALKRDIVNLNPDAFINADPARLLANKRLWLPGYMNQADTRVNPSSTTVESYSWGNIKRAIN